MLPSQHYYQQIFVWLAGSKNRIRFYELKRQEADLKMSGYKTELRDLDHFVCSALVSQLACVILQFAVQFSFIFCTMMLEHKVVFSSHKNTYKHATRWLYLYTHTSSNPKLRQHHHETLCLELRMVMAAGTMDLWNAFLSSSGTLYPVPEGSNWKWEWTGCVRCVGHDLAY